MNTAFRDGFQSVVGVAAKPHAQKRGQTDVVPVRYSDCKCALEFAGSVRGDDLDFTQVHIAYRLLDLFEVANDQPRHRLGMDRFLGCFLEVADVLV